MSNYSWTCPFCQRPVTITGHDINSDKVSLTLENADGYRVATCTYVVCPNEECKKFSLTVTLSEAFKTPTVSYPLQIGRLLKTYSLVPPSSAKTFPDYIPVALRSDYEEACLIKDLSPKAAATLARRCLQGIIRDFWKVKPGRLIDEVNQLQDKVDALTWQAIDAVRSVGNIGAHMEKDIDLIVDIDPNEADLLIGLVEMLFKDCYVAREQKTSHLSAIIKLAKEKEKVKKTDPEKQD